MANYKTVAVPNSQLSDMNISLDTSFAPDLRPQMVYDRALLEILRQSEFKWEDFGQKKNLPKNSGTDTINFRKFGKLEPALTPLTEGITPAPVTASKTSVTGKVSQYGQWMAFTDVVSFREHDPIIASYTEELSYSAKETMDIIVRDIISYGTQVRYAQNYTYDSNGRVTGYDNKGNTTPTDPVISRDKLAPENLANLRDFRKIVRDLRKNHVRPVSEGKYIAYIDEDTKFDLMDDPTFQKFMDYGSTNKPMYDNEVATIFGIRFLVVTNSRVIPAGVDPDGAGSEVAAPANTDVHCSIVLGRNAFGVTGVEGHNAPKMIIKKLGSAGTEDPLDQRHTIGWKLDQFGAVRLEEQAIVRYEHAVSA